MQAVLALMMWRVIIEYKGLDTYKVRKYVSAIFCQVKCNTDITRNVTIFHFTTTLLELCSVDIRSFS
jgi:hypothetical protein